MDHPNLTRVRGLADTFSPLSKVQEAVEKKSAVREFFNVFGIISHYKCERGKKRLVIRDEEISDISISLNWKKELIWNPDRKIYNRDDFEIGDVVRIMNLCVENGTCLISTVKQLSVMKSFSKSGTFDCRTQGVDYVRFDQFDKTRSQQLIRFLSNEITSCRFCDIPPESGTRSFCGRVTSTAVTPEGHQIICLSDGTRPVIKSHSVTGQKYLLSSGRSKRGTASEDTLQLKVTDAVSTDQAVTPDDVIVVFNAKFEHQPESGLTLIATNRNKKDGKAVRIADPDSQVGQTIDDHPVTDQVRESGDENPDALRPPVQPEQKDQTSSSLRTKTTTRTERRKISDRRPKSPETSAQESEEHQPQTSSPAFPSSPKLLTAKKLETGSRIESPTGRLFPFYMDTPIPLTVTPISQLLHPTDNSYQFPSYAVEAAATDCSFTHGAICDLIHVRCRYCQFTESLQDRLGDDAGQFVSHATRFGVVRPIKCPEESCLTPKGEESMLDLVFNFFFRIRDKSGSEMIVCLSTFSAIKLFGVIPKDALMRLEKRETVFKILDAICPSDEDDRHDNFLMWLLKPSTIGKTGTQFFVLTVTSGCSASKAPDS